MDMSRRPSKRRASAKSTSDTGRDAPSDHSMQDVVTSVLLQPQLPTLVTTYGTSNRTQPKLHYSLSEIMKNPLRHYPSPMALYGMEPDGALLTHPVLQLILGGWRK